MNDPIGDHRWRNHRHPRQHPQANAGLLYRIAAYLCADLVEAAKLGTRILTIIFAFATIFPLFDDYELYFNKALVSNAATCAFRLHQRLLGVPFNEASLDVILAEDAAHYLVYSMILFGTEPSITILTPLVLFSILHATRYVKALLLAIGVNAWNDTLALLRLVELQSRNILRWAAFAEIRIVTLLIQSALFGHTSMFTLLGYYHFLRMRYKSQRNPYSRYAFGELRHHLEFIAEISPRWVSIVLRSLIDIVRRVAPRLPRPG